MIAEQGLKEIAKDNPYYELQKIESCGGPWSPTPFMVEDSKENGEIVKDKNFIRDWSQKNWLKL